MLETQQFAPTRGSAPRRRGAYDPQPAGFLSTDTDPTESASRPLPDQGATRIRFPEFADEPYSYPAQNRTEAWRSAPHFAPKSLLDKHLLVIAATTPVKSAQF